MVRGRGGRTARGDVGTDVAQGTGEGATGTVFCHVISRPRDHARDGARATPDAMMCLACPVFCICAWVGGMYILTLAPRLKVAGMPYKLRRSAVVCCA
jgi:hypothetical protein